ncbi:olfactory receptor 8H1-like [Erpetoichthys calabaricus]|uniref:olfactory receptor 8H1-like n=1 Tax=Erpetoichthys calabaricus TaxID=27687 RepID=UPI0022346ABF|nr:olfactory receptor 8H1-like [Erpetoichthys calabaricus]
MNDTNTSVSNFVLSCLKEIEEKELAGAIFIIIYLVTIFGNTMVIVIIITDHQLQRPMFLCITVLSLIDLTCSTTIVLKILAILLFNNNLISHSGCLAQMFILHHMEALEIFLLTLMAFDRYVAINDPLRYPAVITNKVILASIAGINVLGVILVMVYMFFAETFNFCSTNILPYCFCDFTAMLRTACLEDTRYIIYTSTLSAIFIVFTFLLIVFSYAKIILLALKMSSADGKKKALSTCVTHLSVVGLFYFPLIFIYVVPTSRQPASSTVASSMIMVSTIMPPMLNPLIYSLRNKEIKQSIQKAVKRKRVTTFIFN